MKTINIAVLACVVLFSPAPCAAEGEESLVTVYAKRKVAVIRATDVAPADNDSAQLTVQITKADVIATPSKGVTLTIEGSIINNFPVDTFVQKIMPEDVGIGLVAVQDLENHKGTMIAWNGSDNGRKTYELLVGRPPASLLGPTIPIDSIQFFGRSLRLMPAGNRKILEDALASARSGAATADFEVDMTIYWNRMGQNDLQKAKITIPLSVTIQEK